MGDVSGLGGGRYDAPENKHIAIAASSSGNNTIITATASLRIAVLGIKMQSRNTVVATWEDGAGGTDMIGAMEMLAREYFVLPLGARENYWFICTVNTLLNLNLSAAIAVNGIVTYHLIP